MSVMHETWKPMPNFEEFYEVSSNGRVKRSKPGQGTRKGYILKAFPAQSAGRYAHVMICPGDGKPRSIRLHKKVAEAFLGRCPAGKEVNHKNGDRMDARLENLEYVTRSENQRHRYRVLGHHSPRGESHYNSKLTDAIVRKIRLSCKQGIPGAVVARWFGVTKEAVYHILKRRAWAHVA